MHSKWTLYHISYHTTPRTVHLTTPHYTTVHLTPWSDYFPLTRIAAYCSKHGPQCHLSLLLVFSQTIITNDNLDIKTVEALTAVSVHRQVLVVSSQKLKTKLPG